jgi:hypothetical protein
MNTDPKKENVLEPIYTWQNSVVMLFQASALAMFAWALLSCKQYCGTGIVGTGTGINYSSGTVIKSSHKHRIKLCIRFSFI